MNILPDVLSILIITNCFRPEANLHNKFFILKTGVIQNVKNVLCDKLIHV